MKLSELIGRLEAMGKSETCPKCGLPHLFRGKPERWWEAHRWRCVNDHVSSSCFRSERKGSLCSTCFTPVVLTFPEDVSGPLDDKGGKT